MTIKSDNEGYGRPGPNNPTCHWIRYRGTLCGFRTSWESMGFTGGDFAQIGMQEVVLSTLRRFGGGRERVNGIGISFRPIVAHAWVERLLTVVRNLGIASQR